MEDKEYIYKFKLVPANILSLVILIVLAVLTIIINNKMSFSADFLITTLLLYFTLHEIVHAIGYILSGAKPKNIYLGIALEKGILYCLCREEVPKKCILSSLQMPFMVIGVITYVIGMIIGNNLLVLLSIFNMAGASMDLMMFLYFARLKNIRYSETDANDEFVLISKEDLTKKKSLFFYIKDIKPYNKKDFIFKKKKRIEISKVSYVILVLAILLDLVTYLLK